MGTRHPARVNSAQAHTGEWDQHLSAGLRHAHTRPFMESHLVCSTGDRRGKIKTLRGTNFHTLQLDASAAADS